MLSYVYEHEKRDLASRLVSTQHHHHDLSVATLHVHINHDDCLEIAVLKGDMGDVQHFADDVIAQRGVRHGHLQGLPTEKESPTHKLCAAINGFLTRERANAIMLARWPMRLVAVFLNH